MSEQDRWLDAYSASTRARDAHRSVPCPHCGEKDLRLLFGALGDGGVLPALWCEDCHRGMPPVCGAELPAWGASLLRSQRELPDYQIQADGSDEDGNTSPA